MNFEATGTRPGGNESPTRREMFAYGPAPNDVLADALRSQVGRDLLGAFGVPAALFESRGDGAGQREAWRRLWAGTIAPLGAVLSAELRRKLDPGAEVGFSAMRAADEDGRSRAISRRAQAWAVFRKEGIEDPEARRLAGI